MLILMIMLFCKSFFFASGFETPPKGLKGYRGGSHAVVHSKSLPIFFLPILLLLLQSSSPPLLLQSFHSRSLRPPRWTLDDHPSAAKWYSCDRTVLLEVYLLLSVEMVWNCTNMTGAIFLGAFELGSSSSRAVTNIQANNICLWIRIIFQPKPGLHTKPRLHTEIHDAHATLYTFCTR